MIVIAHIDGTYGDVAGRENVGHVRIVSTLGSALPEKWELEVDLTGSEDGIRQAVKQAIATRYGIDVSNVRLF